MDEKPTAVITLEDLLRQCSVRVHGRVGKSHAGTGFFVAPGYVATCAHVVAAVGDPVSIILHNGETLAATVCERRIDNDYEPRDWPDLALLAVKDSEASHRDYAVLDADVREGDTLFSWGFPEKYPDGDSLTVVYEGPFEASGYTQLLKLKQGQVQWGYSGAPLLNKRTGAICGFIKSTRDFAQDLGGRAVSVSLLLESLSNRIGDAQSPPVVALTRWGLLRGLSRVAADGSGSLSATISGFFDKWTRWSAPHLLEFGASERLDGDLVPSSIESEWEDFVHTLPWRSRIRDDLSNYSEYATKLGIDDLPVLPLDTAGCYNDVRERLGSWIRRVKPRWEALESAVRKRSHRHGSNEERDNFKRARDTWSRLVQMADPGQARLCIAFPIFGPLGCGKTQFIRSRKTELGVSGEWYAKGWQIALFLPIPARSLRGDIEHAILNRVGEASEGYAWRSLGDLDRLLSALKVKLVIAVDNLDQAVQESGVCRSICDFIANHTHLDSLTYLLSIRDTQIDLITPKADAWTLFSYRNADREPRHPNLSSRVSRMAGWLDLGHFNRERELGYKILTQAGLKEEVDLLRGSKTLPSPLEAKIMIYMIGQGSDMEFLASLNFFNFLDVFWNELIPRWSDAIDQSKIMRALPCVAEAVVSSANLAPPRDRVEQALASAQIDPESALALLKRASLLSIDAPEPSFQAFRKDVSSVHLNYPYLWNKTLAEQLWRDRELAVGEHDTEVVEWLEKVTTDRQVREGIWEFVLLLADAAMDPRGLGQLGRERTYQIWTYAFEEPRLPVRAPCLAARWASDQTQKHLAAVLHQRSEAVVQDGSLFALLFFAMEASALSPPRRFDLIRPHYVNVPQSGLAPYFLNGADRALDGLKEPAHLDGCLSALAHSHLTGLASQLASSAWDAFVALHGENAEVNLKVLMDGFLLYDGDNARSEHSSWNREQGRRPRFFREEFLVRALDWSWQAQHHAMRVWQFFDFLRGIGWYDAATHGIDRHIAHEMRSEANLSFGRHFRALERRGDQEEAELESYKALIRDLLVGEIRDIRHGEELGYFMLRHTDFAAGRTAHISRALWEEVDIAHSIPALERFFASHPITKELRTGQEVE